MGEEPSEIPLPNPKEKQLLKKVEELKYRIYQLEEELQIIQKNKAKKKKKKKRQKKKKKQKEKEKEKKEDKKRAPTRKKGL